MDTAILTNRDDTLPETDEERSGMSPPDRRMNAALTGVALFGVALALLSLVGWGIHVAGGVALGAAIATLNLWAFTRIGQALLSGEQRRVARWASLGVFKLVALMGGVYLLIDFGLVEPIPLMVGYAALPAGITLATLFNKPDDTV